MGDATTIEVDWWGELDEEVIACLRGGPQSTQELAWKLGMSSTAVTSVLFMLATEGKVRITGAELAR